MVQRRHAEDAATGQLERDHLHDHRNGFEHEQTADHRQHDLVLGRDRDRAKQSAERERAGVAHEDRRRRRVEPEKAEARTEHRATQHDQLAAPDDEVDLQVVRIDRVADQIGDECETQGRDHHRADRQSVEPVSQVHRIAGADDDERAEDDEQPAEVEH